MNSNQLTYDQLMQQKIQNLTQQEQLEPNPIFVRSRSETPQFSDRKFQNTSENLVQTPQIQVNWNLLTDIVEDKQYGEEEFYLILEQINIQATEQMWKFFLLLAYDEQSWKYAHQISYNKLKGMFGIVFDCIQGMTDLKKQQIEEIIQYRSIAHLNRILFQNKLGSFEKNIQLIKNQILENPHRVFNLVDENLAKNESFSKFVPNADKQEKLTYSPLDKKTNYRGNQRSEKLYQYSKQQQDKNKMTQLLKTVEENKQLSLTPKKLLNKKSDVHERLYKEAKKTATPKRNIYEKEEALDKECTFKPELISQKVNKNFNYYSQQKSEIKGFDNQLQRMKKAQEDRYYKERFHEIQLQKIQQTNKNPEVKEFKLSEKEQLEEPILYLDVKVSKNKVGRLGVRKGDNIEEITENFSKTFQLSNEQKEKLLNNLKQAYKMIQQ